MENPLGGVATVDNRMTHSANMVGVRCGMQFLVKPPGSTSLPHHYAAAVNLPKLSVRNYKFPWNTTSS